jgi:hypothetical protein
MGSMRSRLWLAVIAVFFVRAAFGATQLITNGGFEGTSYSPWMFPGTQTGIQVVTDSTQAHGGLNFLTMGNLNGPINPYQIASQSVSIPSNALLVRLNYFWNVSSAESGGTVQLRTLIVNSNQTQILATVDTQLNPSFTSFPYQQTGFDLTSLTGKTVQIYFELQAIAGSGANTAFRIDDVSVLSLTAADLPTNDYFTNRTTLSNTTNLLSVTATNVLATKEPGEPKHAGNPGGHSLWWKWTAPSNGFVKINTDGSSFDTVMAAYTGTVVSNLTQVAANDDDNGGLSITSQIKFNVIAGTQYQIAVDGKSGAIGVVLLNLKFSADTKAPTVSITSPAANARLTNSTVVVQGKALDNLAVALVEFRLENALGTNDYQAATGTNTWSATVTDLIPGPNTVRIRATDISGIVSATVARTFSYAVVSRLTLTVSGGGTVTPNLNDQLLDVGASYTITAKPNVGQVFASWSGDLGASAAVLKFTMQSNLVLQANFIPNPFGPAVGNYQGLFYDTDVAAHQSSGFFNATVASAGAFSAKILLGGQSYSLSGQFSGLGISSNAIVRKGLTPVTAQLQLDLNGGGITGQLSDGTWTADLNAYRASASAPAGKYTLLLPGRDDSAGGPGGDGFGTVSVDALGNISFSGTLGDGTKAAQKALVNANGQWPFYISLSKGNGSILGWLTFSNQIISGPMEWFVLAQPKAKLYRAGFTNDIEAAGSSYQFTAGVPVLNFTDGQVWLANGNLAGFTNQISLGADSKVTNLSTSNALTLTVTTTTGLFKGSVVNPITGKAVAINGVVLQQQNFGGGFFLGTNQSGRVYFGP